ncbi:MAG: hypothetical protein NVSMB64_01900 [Candidatus Velthaea sp.]
MRFPGVVTPQRTFSILIAAFVVCAVAPIGWITTDQVRRTSSALAVAHSEKAGLKRIDGLRALFLRLSTERELRDLHGSGAPGTVQLRSSIDATVRAMSVQERRDHLAGEAWSAFVSAWRSPFQQNRDRVFDALLRATVHASEHSRLSYESDDAGLDLDDAATYRFPAAIEALQRTELGIHRGLHTGRLRVSDRLDLTASLAQARGDARFGFDDIIEAQARDHASNVSASLHEHQLAAQAATESFADDLSRSIRTDAIPLAAFPRIETEAERAVASLYGLQAAISPALGAIVDRRIHALVVSRRVTIGRGTASLAIAILVGVLAWRNLRHRGEMLRVRREAERFASEARFRVIFDRAATGIVVVDRTGTVVEANPTFERMLGYPPRYFIGKRMAPHTSRDDREVTLERFAALAAGTIDMYQYEKRYLRADGTEIWGDVSVTKLDDNHPSDWFAIGLIEDVTARKKIEDRLLYDATHDGLTGLANRSLFAARLDDVLARRSEGTAAIIFIDLDHFKVINDSLGHAAGDRLLRTVAERLLEQAGPRDTVARFGGDEFAILFSDLSHVADLTRRVNLIQYRIAEPLMVQGRSIYTTASIGVAPLNARYAQAEDLLRDADTAMYRAKADGRARAAIFDNAMHEGAVRRLARTSDLRAALPNGELRLAYQPLIRLAARTVVGYEALMRWEHPRDGTLMPDDFIPLAEETGLIVPMGRWALEEAIRHLAVLHRTQPALTMHVNLSVQEVMQSDTAAYIRASLLRHGVSAACVVVEITESAVIESTRNSDASLRQLRDIGVGVCIDDFGVGYSSLRYLHRFPISGLKIDRSFVNGSNDDLASEPIVRMVLDLARTLGLDVVAEGIESERQAEALQTLGCLYGQGYFFAAPHVADDAHREPAAQRH